MVDKTLLNKVKKTILEHLEDEKFGVEDLASEIGFSKSQLWRKVKAITGKSLNQIIREIRLNEAVRFIKNSNLTASEISYKVGFGSPSYFNKCFHDHFGCTPGEYKTTMEDSSDPYEVDLKIIKSVKIKFQRNILLGLLLIIVVAAISYAFYNSSVKQKEKGQIISIAVMPFKNLSDDKTNQYFADGVMDDILNHLSSIKEFKVISRTTMDQYRETQKTAPEIAKELKVTYIIESTIQKYNDSIKIITQLIDAKNDKHVWSKHFGREFNNIFALESEIAKQIAEELNITLSPAELNQIEKIPTENLEAYKMYLNGRFYWHQRTKKDLNKSLYYFNKALASDSTYALAYAGLADAYYIMAWWGWYPKNEGFNKAKEFAQKAIAIDNNIAEAHATLGGILTFHEWNWKEAERELKLAISLNPNYATAHHYYYELLEVLCRNEEARNQINLALELNPYSLIMNRQSAYSYYNTEDYKKAIDVFYKAIDLEVGNNVLIYPDKLSIVKCYIHLGWNELALETIKKFISTDPSINNKVLDDIYYKSGIEGLVSWFINWMFEHKSEKYINNIMTASFYSIIGDSQNALKVLEKAFEEGDSGMPFIKNNPDFNTIKTEPRFIAILKKMNLAD